jgi:phosphoribosyl 1,2-cyclic phosphodiesterase
MSTQPPRDYRPGMIELLNLGASVMLDDQLYHVVAKIRKYPQANQHYSMHFDGELNVRRATGS